MTAITVTVWLCENSNTSGGTSSPNIPGPFGEALGQPRRAQILWEVAVVQPFDRVEGEPRHVRHHRREHVGEVPAELREPGAQPHADDQQLRGHNHVHEREEHEEDQRGDVLLAACRDEQHLVAQAEDHEQRNNRDESGWCNEALVRGQHLVDSVYMHTGQRERHDQRGQQ
jgi:hypothetical protein